VDERVITVRLGTPRGLDDEAELLKGLENATDLSWSRTEGTDKALSGIGEIILSAAVSGLAGAAFNELLGKVNDVAEKVKKRHLDPPPITVEHSEGPADAADAGSVAPGAGS
jgi:hypothetical protein